MSRSLSLWERAGDIHRFAHPKKLAKHVGLNPAFDDSGEGKWSGKMITSVGSDGLKKLGKTRKTFREEIFQSLQTEKVYVLYSPGKFIPKVSIERPLTLAQEYGLQ